MRKFFSAPVFSSTFPAVFFFGIGLICLTEAATPNLHYGKVFFRLGERSERQGDILKAMSYYRKAAFLNPALGESYQAMGMIYFKEGFYRDAIACLQQSTSLENPTSAEASFYLAVALRRVKDYRRALLSIWKAIGLSQPQIDIPFYHYTCGELYLLLGIDRVMVEGQIKHLKGLKAYALAQRLEEMLNHSDTR